MYLTDPKFAALLAQLAWADVQDHTDFAKNSDPATFGVWL